MAHSHGGSGTREEHAEAAGRILAARVVAGERASPARLRAIATYSLPACTALTPAQSALARSLHALAALPSSRRPPSLLFSCRWYSPSPAISQPRRNCTPLHDFWANCAPCVFPTSACENCVGFVSLRRNSSRPSQLMTDLRGNWWCM